MYKLLSLLFVVLLAGCSDNPATKVDSYFADKNYEAATKWLEKKLEDAPGDQLLNGLAAEAYTQLCLQKNCYATANAPEVARINTLLSRVRNKRIPVGEDGKIRNIHENIKQALRAESLSENGPQNIVKFQQSFTDGASKILLNQQISALAHELFTTLKTQTVGENLLKEIGNAAGEDDYNGHLASLAVAISTKNAVDMNVHLTGVRTKARNAQANRHLAASFPMAFYRLAVQEDPKNGALAFAQGLYKQIQDLNTKPLLKNSATNAMAQSVAEMAEDQNFLTNAMAHFNVPALPPVKDNVLEKPANTTTETPVVESAPLAENSPAPNQPNLDDPKQILSMMLLKQAILLNPRSTEFWQKFTPLALGYAARTGSYDHLDGLAKVDAPAPSLKDYNNHMIALATQYRQSGKDALAPLSYVILPEEGGDAYKKPRDQILIEMLDAALEAKDTDEMVRIASFDVDVAKESRQKIVNSLILAMKELWDADNYQPILDYTNFLVKTMGIEFNLDGLLLQNLETYLQEENFAEKLTTNTPEFLLEAQKDVALDLGPKMNFLTDYFKTNPAVMDTQLKKLILKAEGTYGRPVAFYRLQHYINASIFPKEEQETYFLNVLQTSLLDDASLSGPGFADLGYQLSITHPQLSLEFIVSEALKRTKTLEDSRHIWRISNADMRDVLKAVNPQFTALMVSIDAFEKADYLKALTTFSTLEDANLLAIATDYINFYRDLMADIQGTYITEQMDDNMKAIIVNIAPQISKPREAQDPLSESYLAGLNITVINGVGTLHETSTKTLTEDYGAIYRASIKAVLNPNTQGITLQEENRADSTFNHSFEKTFGRFSSLSFPDTGEMRLKVEPQEEAYRFRRIDPNPYQPLFVFGRYGTTRQISAADPATDHILPPGSILEIETDVKSPLQPMRNGKKLPIIFPVFGTLQHPASDEDIKLGGFYNLSKHTLNLSYKYPYGQNQAPLEARLRCQILESYLRCAGHNKHWERKRYSHIVVGRKATGGPSMPVAAQAEAQADDLEDLEPVHFPHAEEVDALDFPDVIE